MNEPIEDETARGLVITCNTTYHVGVQPIMNKEDALALTIRRKDENPGWTGAINTVIYYYNLGNILNSLIESLIDGNYHIMDNNAHYLVQLPDLNLFLVNRDAVEPEDVVLSDSQVVMRIDPTNMKAYHMIFPNEATSREE